MYPVRHVHTRYVELEWKPVRDPHHMKAGIHGQLFRLVNVVAGSCCRLVRGLVSRSARYGVILRDGGQPGGESLD